MNPLAPDTKARSPPLKGGKGSGVKGECQQRLAPEHRRVQGREGYQIISEGSLPRRIQRHCLIIAHKADRFQDLASRGRCDGGAVPLFDGELVSTATSGSDDEARQLPGGESNLIVVGAWQRRQTFALLFNKDKGPAGANDEPVAGTSRKGARTAVEQRDVERRPGPIEIGRVETVKQQSRRRCRRRDMQILKLLRGEG